METRTLHVSGMTCPGCNRSVERAVTVLEGVCSAQADYIKGELRVTYGPPCCEERLRTAVADAGYHVADKPERDHSALYILVILLGLLVIARQMGWTAVFQVFPVVGTERVGYAALFLIGIFTSVHCVAMCGGINLGQSVAGSEPRPVRRSLLYNLGRLTSYTLTGGVLGAVGEAAAVTLRVRGLIGLAAGCCMVLMGINMLGRFQFLRRLALKLPAPVARGLAAVGRHGPFSIGLVNGLMPCGPLQSMQLYAIASGSFAAGALSMFAFCLGTLPLVLLFGAAAGALRLGWKEKMLRLSAALLVFLGLIMVQNNLALSGVSVPTIPETGTSSYTASTVMEDTQNITTYLHTNGYDDIQVVAGIPVVWTIIVEDGTLNGCNNELVLPAFDRQIWLSEGENIITFTPEKAGSYSYSCWMGMLRNTITVTEV